jgi:hypothetical protein
MEMVNPTRLIKARPIKSMAVAAITGIALGYSRTLRRGVIFIARESTRHIVTDAVDKFIDSAGECGK